MQSSLWREKEANPSCPMYCLRSVVAVLKCVYKLRFKLLVLIGTSVILLLFLLLSDKMLGSQSSLQKWKEPAVNVIAYHGIKMDRLWSAAETESDIVSDDIEEDDEEDDDEEDNEDEEIILSSKEYEKMRTTPALRKESQVSKKSWMYTDFNINKSDIIVMLHVQKTGGSEFQVNLVVNTTVRPSCKCKTIISHEVVLRPRCECPNADGRVWLVSRWSVGWICGLHADYTELSTCLEPYFIDLEGEHTRTRRYDYVTILRDPVERFLSEWRHVKTGATWETVRLFCGGRPATEKEVPPCFAGDNWKGVQLTDFFNCRSNLAFNRQTRMLADLSLSDCYRLDSNLTHEQRNQIMLDSAKHNLLHTISFIGLHEYQRETYLLFESTFPGLKFEQTVLKNKNPKGENRANYLSTEELNRVLEANDLDVQLYDFAKDLFLSRLDDANIAYEEKLV